jgi:hypothetical protein
MMLIGEEEMLWYWVEERRWMTAEAGARSRAEDYSDAVRNPALRPKRFILPCPLPLPHRSEVALMVVAGFHQDR